MKHHDRIALIAVTRAGAERARKLDRLLGHASVFTTDVAEEEGRPLASRVAEWFGQYDQLVFFLAAGAVVRLIAPCLGSKQTDPGVLCVDEAGQFVVALLSGHQGGANAFTRRVAGCLGAVPVVTTASDVIGGLSVDLLEGEYGWKAEPAERLKATAMSLVQGEPVAIIQEIGTLGSWLDERQLPANVTYCTDVATLPAQTFSAAIWITDRVPPDFHGLDDQRILWFRPHSLALGVGCERGITLQALEDGLDQFLRATGFAQDSIDVLTSASVKEDETALLELAQRHGWRTAFYPAEELARVPNIPNPSAVVAKCVATPGVAEPAALLAAGSAHLVAEKHVLASSFAPQRMTFALARLAGFSQRPVTLGSVTFVGAGPGDPELLTLKASRVLQKSEVVIYAGSLIPERILDHVPRTAVLHNSAHMTLEQVRDIILTATAAGKRVARMQSGDPSIYGAVQEQIAFLEEHGIDCDIIPGISSFQAAAAALRSELTIPEVVQTIILTRGEGDTPKPDAESIESLARHQASMCLFLSAKLAEDVQEKLLSSYPPDTPTAIAYRVSWPDEKILLTRLDQLAAELHRQKWSRTVLILVGKALGSRQNRSQLYDPKHGHIFRRRSHGEDGPAT